MKEILSKALRLIRSNVYLFALVMIIVLYLLAIALGAINLHEPIAGTPISPLSPISPPETFVQQALETPAPTPTQTPTPTPTHWTSSNVEVWCSLENVSGSPLELWSKEEELPMMSLTINLQIRDTSGEVLLQQAIFNLMYPFTDCQELFGEYGYDWRNFEDNLAIPAEIVEEWGKLSYNVITTNTLYRLNGTPWNPDEQQWIWIQPDGIPVTVESNKYVHLRSFDWASPTPTPTATPTSTPIKYYYRIYLPVILRGR